MAQNALKCNHLTPLELKGLTPKATPLCEIMRNDGYRRTWHQLWIICSISLLSAISIVHQIYSVTCTGWPCTDPGVVRVWPVPFPGWDRLFCLYFVFLVYIMFCFIVFGCQYQCNRLSGKTRL